jgi:lysophospholipase L1-like esterase
MWRSLWLEPGIVLTLILAPALLQAQQAGAPVVGAPPAPAVGRGPAAPLLPATEPRPRDDARHQSFLEIAKGGNVDLLFVGDSITDFWDTPGRGLRVWDEYFAPLKAANFGISGDTTQGVLWRMRNGELIGFKAKLIVLMLGTNNLSRNPVDEIAAGDRLIVDEFRKQQPQAKVLILGIFPRGMQPGTTQRTSIKAINQKLAALADNTNVFYLDIGHTFLAEDGTLPVDIMPDGLHPNERGYKLWAEATIAKVQELLK